MKKLSLYLTDRQADVLQASADRVGITLAEELRRVLDSVLVEWEAERLTLAEMRTVLRRLEAKDASAAPQYATRQPTDV